MDTNIKALLGSLRESALSSSLKHLETYLDAEDEILNHIANINGIKSEFYCYEVEELKRMTIFLSLYSDFTSIFTAPSSKNNYKVQNYHSDHPRNITRQLTIPPTLLESNLNKKYPILPCYLLKNDVDTHQMANTIDPFLQKGSFILRPMRILVVTPPGDKKNLDADHEIYFASSDTPDNHWFAKELHEENSFVIHNGLKDVQASNLLELTLPYFDNISIDVLSKVLEDEADLLGKFRVTLKELTKKIIETGNVNEFKNDILRPEIDAINRKFNTIRGLHRFSVGASVATFTLSLIAIQINSNVNFQTIFNTLLGSSAIGILATEIRYQTEMDKLKDSPYFLLWKISKL